MLAAAGLPELVTSNLEDYEALALKLAGDPALLQSTRRKLSRTGPPADCSTATNSAVTSRRLMKRCGHLSTRRAPAQLPRQASSDSVFRRSGDRFAAENASTGREIERLPIPTNRNPLSSVDMTTALPLKHDESIVAEALKYAATFHQRGMLAEAEKFYAAILEARPDHFSRYTCSASCGVSKATARKPCG